MIDETAIEITINDHRLTPAQSMVLRVAVTSFHSEMVNPHALGDDADGRELAALYAGRAYEILALILEG